MKPGIDIEIINEVAIIRVDCKTLPPHKAEEHCKRTAKMFTKRVRSMLGVRHCMFVPYSTT
jgi:hypothetical protein